MAERTFKTITLKNLPDATAQEVFDYCVSSILKQNRKSLAEESSDSACAYRGMYGNKCVAGFLIADDEYKPKMDNIGSWLDLVLKKQVPDTHCDLICDLQVIHDHAKVNVWRLKFRYLSEDLGLEWKLEDI